jgi:hypothetical protein
MISRGIFMITLVFRDETEFGKVALTGSLSLPSGPLTILELLLRRIEADSRLFLAAHDEPYRGLVQPLRVTTDDNEIVLSTPDDPDVAALLDVAVAALSDGRLELMFDDDVITAPTDLIQPREGATVVFIKAGLLLAT